MLSALISFSLLQPSVRKTKIVTSHESFIEEFVTFKKITDYKNCCCFILKSFVLDWKTLISWSWRILRKKTISKTSNFDFPRDYVTAVSRQLFTY